VALAARREDRLGEVQRAIGDGGGEALAVACDVTDRESLDRAVHEATAAFGGIDVVVANAGFGVSGRFDRLETADFRRQFETNFFGVLETLYATLPHLKTSRGQVGIVSSVLGRVGSPGYSAYVASKFALCGLAESLYYEFAEYDVGVTCICPGVVVSEFRQVDNLGLRHADASDPAPGWLVVPTPKAAKAIVRAMHRGTFEAVITGHGKLACGVTRHFPRTCRFVASRVLRGRVETLERQRRGRINE